MTNNNNRTADQFYREGKSAKEYFKETSILADDIVYPINTELVRQIKSFDPESVFEFGCGQGKNLVLLKSLNTYRSVIAKLMGVDINQEAIETGYKKGRGQTEEFTMLYNDESILKLIRSKSYDVSFTCSVLDHIREEDTVKSIIRELKRIAVKGVVLAETLADRPDWYYYPHDYEAMGFVRDPKDYEWLSFVDGNIYHVWKYDDKNKNNKKIKS